MSAPRLNKQLEGLTKGNYIVEKISQTHWNINLAGPENSAFKGGQFSVELRLDGFPFKAPIIKFTTKIYHPNVDENGGICPDMLQIGEKWAPVKKLVDVMDRVKSLLIQPNLQSPMNNKAAQDYKNGSWYKKAEQQTKQYAK